MLLFSVLFCVPHLVFRLSSLSFHGHVHFILNFISPTLLRQCVCVYHLNRCKTSNYCRGPLGNIAVSGQRRCCNVPVKTCLHYIYICIVPPLGAYKSQLGGNIFFRCCFLRSTSTVITYILYIFRSFNRVSCCWCFARQMYSTTKFATAVLSKCVCVRHLKRCKASIARVFPLEYLCPFLFHVFDNKGYFQQGATAPFISPWPTKLLMFGEDMQSDQLHVPAFILILLQFQKWDVANPRTTMPFSNNLFSFFLVCTVFAI